MLLKRVEYFILEDIEDLGNVICDSKTDGFSSLKWLKVQRCGGNEYLIDTTGWASHNIFRILEKLELDEMQNLKNLWKDPFRRVCLRNLRVIEVRSCGKLKNLFSQHTARDLGKLQELSIDECGSLEEIFTNDGGAAATASMGGIVFQNLNSMTLSKLPNLTTFLPPTSDGSLDSTTHPLLFNEKVVLPTLEDLILLNLSKVKEIWHQQLPSANLRNLKLLKIFECNGLRNLFPWSASKGLIQLRELEIDSCEIMKEIVTNASGEEEKEANDVIVFPQLRTLTLKNLPELVTFYQWINYTSAKLTIEAYPKTKAFGSKKQKVNDRGFKGKMIEQGNVDAITESPLFNEKVVFPSLENLYLSGLNQVKEIWHQLLPIANLRNLTLLKISKCNGLRNLFRRFALEDLIQLQELEIDSCEIMKEIVANESGEEEKEANDVIVFPELQTLTLKNLPELVSFYQEINYTSEKLTIEDIPKQKTFGTEKPKENDKEKMNEQGNLGAITQSSLFSEKVLVPNLKELRIRNLQSLKEIWPPQFLAESFSQLRILEVQKCDKLLKVIPSNLLQQLQNLEKLYVTACESVEDVIQLEGANVVVLSQLRRLELCNLPKLVKMWWNKDCNGILSCPNLDYLGVIECNSLRHLFLSSVAKGFVNPRTLYIGDCLNMEEVVAKEEQLGEDSRDKLAFPSISDLILVNLPKLRSFYSGNLTLECPSLSEFNLWNCTNMHTFSSGLLITPMLRNIEADGEILEVEGDLNSSIQQQILRGAGVKDKPNEEVEKVENETIHGEKSKEAADQA